MKVTITKRQEIVNDVAKGVNYYLQVKDGAYFAVVDEKELTDLRDEINRVLTDKGV